MGKTYRREKDPWQKRDAREQSDKETKRDKDRAAKQRELRRHRRDWDDDR